MALSQFIRNLITTDSVFGSEAKKLSGINDKGSRSYFRSVTITGPNLIIVSDYPSVPSWLVTGKSFIIKGDGPNSDKIVQLDLVELDTSTTPSTLTITVVGETLITDTTPREFDLDGRIFAIINDPDIAREAENGSTMFNLDNNSSTGLADGSGVALKYAAHYHSTGDIVSHECNLYGRTMFFADDLSSATPPVPQRYTDGGPQVVFDNDGNVVGGNS